MNHSRLLSNAQAATLLGITPATLRFWRCKGRGPRYVKLEQRQQAHVFYDEAEVLAFREARTFRSTSAATVHHPDSPPLAQLHNS
jgi:hypothetical protein